LGVGYDTIISKVFLFCALFMIVVGGDTNLYFQTVGVVGIMNKKRKLIIVLAIAALVAVAVSALFPIVDVNVIFAHPLDNNELATVFQDTSFRTIQYMSVVDWGQGGGGGAFTNNSIFGTPLYGAALEAALESEPQGTGFAVLAGRISFIDLVRIENSPFVYDVVIYSPYFRLQRLNQFGQRRILAGSQIQFYENMQNR